LIDQSWSEAGGSATGSSHKKNFPGWEFLKKKEKHPYSMSIVEVHSVDEFHRKCLDVTKKGNSVIVYGSTVGCDRCAKLEPYVQGIAKTWAQRDYPITFIQFNTDKVQVLSNLFGKNISPPYFVALGSELKPPPPPADACFQGCNHGQFLTWAAKVVAYHLAD
jgi:hypothetical protein